jgi:hypothetical protein
MTTAIVQAIVTATTIGIVRRAHFHWKPAGFEAAAGSRKTGEPIIVAPHPLQNGAGSGAVRPHCGQVAGGRDAVGWAAADRPHAVQNLSSALIGWPHVHGAMVIPRGFLA